MPIFMKIEGIDGAAPSAGGASGSVWKTTNFLTDDATNALNVSRISMPNSLFGVLDSREANVVEKARTMFAAPRSTVASQAMVFSVLKSNAPQMIRAMQHLRQAATGGGRIPVMRLLVVGGDSKKLEIEFKGVRIFNFGENGGGVSFTVEPTATAALLLPAVQRIRTWMYRK